MNEDKMELEDAKSYLKKVIKVNRSIVNEARINGNKKEIELTEALNTQSIAIETVLQSLENSIPKKKIEDKIKEYENKHIRDKVLYGTNTYNVEIKLLQELLEEK